MSTKRMLNKTSRKKRDTMLNYTNVTVTNPAGGTTFSSAGAILTGGNPYVLLWCPTARNLNNSTGGADIVINRSERTATTCFMRGLAERVHVETTDGMPWTWRRICFTIKGDFISNLIGASNLLFQETAPGGYRRSVTNWSGFIPVQDLVFQGRNGIDWLDIMTAPTDSTRISVKYDKLTHIAGGNEEGTDRVYRRWMPMNKYLVYDDEENGDGELSSFFSTQGKQGMGDYYVMDLFTARTGATTASQLKFTPEATLYWHEK